MPVLKYKQNGVWVPVAGGSGAGGSADPAILVVTASEDTMTASHSATEIIAADNAGKPVFLKFDGSRSTFQFYWYALTGENKFAYFKTINLDEATGNIEQQEFRVDDYKAVTSSNPVNYVAPIDGITASVGQIPAVKSVDENGNPVEWEAVNMPSAVSSTIDLESVEDENGTGVQITVHTVRGTDGGATTERYIVYNGKDGADGSASNMLVVQVVGSTASHSSTEIYEAIQAGKEVVVEYGSGVFYKYTGGNSASCAFGDVTQNVAAGSFVGDQFIIDSNKNVEKRIDITMAVPVPENAAHVLVSGTESIGWLPAPTVGIVDETELINGTFTTELIPDFQAYGKNAIAYTKTITIPTAVNVTLDGVEYKYLAVTNVPGLGHMAGNLSKVNPFGFQYEDTGEPFAVGIGTSGGLLATDLTQSTTHDFRLSIVEATVPKTLAPEYLAPDPAQGKVLSIGQNGIEWTDIPDNGSADDSENTDSVAVEYVTFTKDSEGNYACSHTVGEIKALVDAGKLVLGMEKISNAGDWLISQISMHCDYEVSTAGYMFSGRYEAVQDGIAGVSSKLYIVNTLTDGTEKCDVIEGQYFMSTVPIIAPTEDDVGKVLSYTGSVMEWVAPSGGSAVPSAEGVEF